MLQNSSKAKLKDNKVLVEVVKKRLLKNLQTIKDKWQKYQLIQKNK